MIVPVAFLLALCAIASSAQELPVELQTHSFVTQLDHFRPQDERTANITYHANLAHYQPGGPFYIFIKDVFDRSTQWIESGLMVDVARNTSAALFTYDPRYWGENTITETSDLESLQFMTPEQTLEDLATFIEHLREHFYDSSPTILWGSGYGATAATWARKKYPHLVDAVWSSSGVFDLEPSTLRVIDTLSYTIQRAVNYQCRDRLSEALWELNTLVASGDAEQIAEQLSLCSVGNLTDAQEIGLLYETVLYYVIDTVETRHTPGLRSFCSSLETPVGRPLQALGRWMNYAYGNDACREVSYADLVELGTKEQWAEGGKRGLRQYAYTQCTQTGLFLITDNITWLPNRISLAYHQRKCEDLFGARFNFANLARANAALERRYGAQYQSVSKVLYTNGMLDLWFSHGIAYSRDRRTDVLNIEHFARSADLGSINVGGDAVALNLVKEAIFEQIVRWSNE